MSSSALGVGSSDLFTNLSQITTANGSEALKVIDAAINDVSSLRGRLGAFQSNTLESNANNLKTTLENTTAAESVIRDTDFASEIAQLHQVPDPDAGRVHGPRERQPDDPARRRAAPRLILG